MFSHPIKLFQLSLITLFAAVLFLGTMGVNTALATHSILEGKLKLTETCDAGAGNKPTKRKIKSDAEFRYNNGSNTPSGPFPKVFSSTLYIADFDGLGTPLTLFGENATSLTKNGKTGVYMTVVDEDGSTTLANGVVLFITAKIKRAKDSDDDPTELDKMAAKITGYDDVNNCQYKGSIKLKECENGNCPNV